QEDADRTIRICRGVSTAKAQLSLRQWRDSVSRQTDQGRLGDFKEPILTLELSCDGNTQQRCAVTVTVIPSLGLKEIPILETQPEIAADSPTRNSNLSWRGRHLAPPVRPPRPPMVTRRTAMRIDSRVQQLDLFAALNHSLLLLWDNGSFQYERAQAQCPRNRNRCRVVADLVITRLIVKRPAERDRILATERSLSLRRTFQDDFLNEGKRLLVNRHTLVERLKKIDLRRWILHRHYSY